MLPVKLKMQAFASYVKPAVIDFERLDSLFLIHGETGAGKTAVLDGMMYALYGESSGGERSEMRCALPAAVDIPTEVEFVFRVRGKLYKFVRMITISPRKKNLEAKQDCFYFDEEIGEYRSFFENPKKDFVCRKAAELTGLTAEQFRQVIILPQGRFERLLVSGSAEKEEILSTMFGAEKYSALSDRLVEMANESRRRIEAETASLSALLAAENVETTEQLTEESARLRDESAAVAEGVKKAASAVALVRERLAAAELLAADFTAFEGVERRLGLLRSESGKIEGLRACLRKNENAAKAKSEAAAAGIAKAAFEKRSGEALAAREKFDAADGEFAFAAEGLAAVKSRDAEFSEKAAELAVLESLAPVYEKITEAEGKIKKLAEERTAYETGYADTEEKLKKAVEKLAALTELKGRITADFSRKIPELSARKTELENGAAAEKKLNKFTAALKKIKENAERLSAESEVLKRRRTEAEEKYDRLYGEYISAAAAELSSKLKEGEPCPVCGSVCHPAPASAAAGRVTAEDVKSARSDFEAAANALNDKLAEAAGERGRIPAAEEYIAAERKIIEECGYSAAELENVRSVLDRAVKENGRLPEIDSETERLAAEKAVLEKSRESEGGRLAEIRAAEKAAAAERAAFTGQLGGRFADGESYRAGVKKLSEEIAAFEKNRQLWSEKAKSAEIRRAEAVSVLERAEAELGLAERERLDAEKAFADKLKELGISSEEEFTAALLDDRLAAEYAGTVERYGMECHAAAEQAEVLKKKLEGMEVPKTEEIRAEAEGAEKALSELSGRSAVIAERLGRLEKAEKEYRRKFEQGEKDRLLHDKLAAFAKHMYGDRGISFTRYVLGIMLRLVAAEANRILADIHGGRFRLCVKTELAANSKQGLELEVENLSAAEGDSVRYGVKNLSGGEKFLISLALSLGLSSVARSRMGGVEIEAMFIDEGFGSLDPASLREAVAILCGLTSRRNTIGIISHVEELKNVIPCAVNIVKEKDGASRVY